MNITMSTTKNNIWEEKNLIEQEKNCLNNNVNEQNNITNDTKNNSTKKACEDTGKISGIYKIINKINSNFYIGSSTDIKSRWYRHKFDLMRGVHPNKHLQNSINKYGIENFNFIIEKEILNPILLLEEEQKLLDTHFRKKYCYNINPGVTKLNGNYNPFYGKQHSEETKIKLRNKAKIRYSDINNHPFYGKHHTEKSKEKIRKARIEKIGNKSPRYDFMIYNFYNKNTNDNFSGTQFDFYKKYNLNKGNICWLIKRKHKSVKEWILK